MAFVKSNARKYFVKYAEHEAPDVLVTGIYIGEEQSKYKQAVYMFRSLEDQSIVALNATGKLTKWIENDVQTGDLVRITYLGLKPISSGPMQGKEAHDFEFEIDHDYRKSQTAPTAQPVTTPSPKPTLEQIAKAMDEGTL